MGIKRKLIYYTCMCVWGYLKLRIERDWWSPGRSACHCSFNTIFQGFLLLESCSVKFQLYFFTWDQGERGMDSLYYCFWMFLTRKQSLEKAGKRKKREEETKHYRNGVIEEGEGSRPTTVALGLAASTHFCWMLRVVNKSRSFESHHLPGKEKSCPKHASNGGNVFFEASKSLI